MSLSSNFNPLTGETMSYDRLTENQKRMYDTVGYAASGHTRDYTEADDAIADTDLDGDNDGDNDGDMLVIRSVNDVCADASTTDEPVQLYDELWGERQLCVLYADANLGKSILAVQIANEVASKGYRVLYIDLELSDKGFQRRATDPDTGVTFKFSPNFYRASYNPLCDDDTDDPDGTGFIKVVEHYAIASKCPVIIIDNIGLICETEKGERALRLMKSLNRLKQMHGWSILMLAHVPKTEPGMLISRDTLAGSKKMMNYVDEAFALGQALSDPAVRYLKQTKCRNNSITYDTDTVMTYHIERKDGLIQLVFDDIADERKLLRSSDRATRRQNEIALTRIMVKDGKTQRQIADELGCSLFKANQLVKIVRANPDSAA